MEFKIRTVAQKMIPIPGQPDDKVVRGDRRSRTVHALDGSEENLPDDRIGGRGGNSAGFLLMELELDVQPELQIDEPLELGPLVGIGRRDLDRTLVGVVDTKGFAPHVICAGRSRARQPEPEAALLVRIGPVEGLVSVLQAYERVLDRACSVVACDGAIDVHIFRHGLVPSMQCSCGSGRAARRRSEGRSTRTYR